MMERRRYYRIDDLVALNYRVVAEEAMALGVARLSQQQVTQERLQKSLSAMDTRLDQLLVEIAEALPEIAEALELLNRKVAIVQRMVGAAAERAEGDSALPMVPTHDVNLSAGGIAFRSPSPLASASFVELELVLFPSYQYICAYGRVADCREDKEADVEFRYKIAVDFLHIREADREFIVSHVMRKQTEYLRARRDQDSLRRRGAAIS